MLVKLSACGGLSFPASNTEIADVCLTVSSHLSPQVISIQISLVQATRPGKVLVADTGGQAGKLVVLVNKPVLEIESVFLGGPTI